MVAGCAARLCEPASGSTSQPPLPLPPPSSPGGRTKVAGSAVRRLGRASFRKHKTTPSPTPSPSSPEGRTIVAGGAARPCEPASGSTIQNTSPLPPPSSPARAHESCRMRCEALRASLRTPPKSSLTSPYTPPTTPQKKHLDLIQRLLANPWTPSKSPHPKLHFKNSSPHLTPKHH
jgi:hypothetical protein